MPLTPGVAATLDTVNATSSGDPIPTCQANFGRGVWFTYTPSANGPIKVSTCGSTFDTVVQVYRGACGALTPVLCNDDNGPDCQGNAASLIFTGTAGTVYRILVGGFASASGRLRIWAGVPNDYCSGAVQLPYGCGTFAMSTLDATSADQTDFYGPTCQTNVGKGVWFTFTLPANGTYSLSTCGSSFDTVLQVYEGFCDVEFRVPVACNDDNGPICSGGNASVTFTGRTNFPYQLYIGGYASAGGDLVVTWDVSPPTIICPPDVAVQCLSDVPPRPTTLTQFINQGGTARDNCDQNLTYQSTEGQLAGGACGGTIRRIHTVTDDAGHSASCTQVITVRDTTPPGIACPPNVAVQCLSDVPARPTTLAAFLALGGQAGDNCDTNLTYTSVDGPLVGGPCGGSIRRTHTVTDNCTNSASCVQLITVKDTTPPTIACPPNFTIQCPSDVPIRPTKLEEFLALGGQARDNCDTSLTYTSVDGQLTGGPCGGTIRRTHTVTDDCTNSASCTQIITVRDTTPPSIACPSNITVRCLSDVPSRPTTLTAFLALGGQASDNCDTSLTYTSVDAQLVGGTCGGTIRRTHTVTDDCTNSASCVQIITVRDTIPPSIVCPSNVTVQCLSSVPSRPLKLDEFLAQGGQASDNCDTSLTYTSVDGPLVGGPCGGTIRRTHTVTDDCTNSASCVQSITVKDTTPPTIACSRDIVMTNATGMAVNFTSTASDNCDSNVSLVCQPPSGSVFPLGRTVVTCTATDACTNRSQCTFTVTIHPPASGLTIQCPSNMVVECASAQATPVAYLVTANSTCSTNVQVICDPPSGSPFPLGETRVRCMATDGCGNKSECEFTVTVVNSAPPKIISVIPQCESDKVLVRFSEPMDPTIASDPSNYALSGGETIVSALVVPGGDGVILETSALSCGTEYVLLVSNLKDRCGLQIDPGQQTFTFVCPPCAVEVAKWSQLPGFLAFSNRTERFGGDRPSDFDWRRLGGGTQVQFNRVVADDFRSDGRPIHGVRWWGSYAAGFDPILTENVFYEDAYVLSFFSDVPSSPTGAFSHPGELLGTYVAPQQAVMVRDTGAVGLDGLPIYEYSVDLSRTCLADGAAALATPMAFRETSNTVYWISISAEVGQSFYADAAGGAGVCFAEPSTKPPMTNEFWGWHTSPSNHLDVSVTGRVFLEETGLAYPENIWAPNNVFYQEIDQAFQLLTESGPCDSIAPTVLSPVEVDCVNSQLLVKFSEPMDVGTASDTVYYAIGGGAAPWVNQEEVEIRLAKVSAAGDQVALTTTPLLCGNRYELTIGGVRDRCGNVLQQGTHISSFLCPDCRRTVSKWSQWPGYLAFGNTLPDGGDRPSSFDWRAPSDPTFVIADDFRSDGRPILSVRWWGSYLPGFEPEPDTGRFVEDGYMLSFFSDVPSGPNQPFSRPGELLGLYVAPVSSVTVSNTGLLGRDQLPIYVYEVELRKTCLRQGVSSIATPTAFLETSNRVYWLGISAEVGVVVHPNPLGAGECEEERSTKPLARENFWGWHTSPSNHLDTSVRGQMVMAGPDWAFPESRWQPNEALFQELDQAFELLARPAGVAPPIITRQPVSLIVTQGATATFTVAAIGTAPLSYQWRYNGTPIPGSTASNHMVFNAVGAQSGHYDVLVADPWGAVISTTANLVVLPPQRAEPVWVALDGRSVPGTPARMDVVRSTPSNTTMQVVIPGIWLSTETYGGRMFTRVQLPTPRLGGLGFPQQGGERGWYDFPEETGYPPLPAARYQNGLSISVPRPLFPEAALNARPRTGREMEQLGIDPAGARPGIPALRGFLAVSRQNMAADLTVEITGREELAFELPAPLAPAGFEGFDQEGFTPPELVDEDFYGNFQGAYEGTETGLSEISGAGAFSTVQVRAPVVQVRAAGNLALYTGFQILVKHLKGTEDYDCPIPWDNWIFKLPFINGPALRDSLTAKGIRIEASRSAHYLILTPREYRDELDEFARWKQAKGLNVDFAYVGNAAGDDVSADRNLIDAYLEAYFQENYCHGVYVLIVGDVNVIPSGRSSRVTGSPDGSGGDSEHVYEVLGNDRFPSLYVGRLSVNSSAELTTQLTKILAYERLPQGGDWPTHATLAANSQTDGGCFGVCAAFPSKYAQAVEQIAGYGGYTAPPDFETLHAGAAVAGVLRAVNQDVVDAVDAGRGQVLYRGHGDEFGWVFGWDGSGVGSGVDFTGVHVGTLNNTAYPIVYAINCLNSRIRIEDAIAEDWMNSQHGAVAHFGASVTSGTLENHERAKGIFRALYEDGFTRLAPALAGAELFSHTATGGGGSWDNNTFCYMLLGDPELTVRKKAVSKFKFAVHLTNIQQNLVLRLAANDGSGSNAPLPTAFVNLNLASGGRLNGFTGLDGTLIISNLQPADIATADIQADGYDSQSLQVGPSIFRVSDIRLDLQGNVIIAHPAQPDYYYVLERGDTVLQITERVAISLSASELHTFSLPSPGRTSFYRVLQVRLDQPLDSDRDGIDDVYELHHATFLNPLDPRDAPLDFDGDGRSNLQEYQAGTDPTKPD